MTIDEEGGREATAGPKKEPKKVIPKPPAPEPQDATKGWDPPVKEPKKPTPKPKAPEPQDRTAGTDPLE